MHCVGSRFLFAHRNFQPKVKPRWLGRRRRAIGRTNTVGGDVISQWINLQSFRGVLTSGCPLCRRRMYVHISYASQPKFHGAPTLYLLNQFRVLHPSQPSPQCSFFEFWFNFTEVCKTEVNLHAVSLSSSFQTLTTKRCWINMEEEEGAKSF